jgi:hypothetical protein
MSRPPGYHATRYALLIAFLITCAALAVVIRIR